MHLIYMDETGNTGTNLNDTAQPVFALAALIISEDQWQFVEAQIRLILNSHFPDRPLNFEIHAAELNSPRHHDYLRNYSVRQRLDFRDELFNMAADADLKLVYRALVKKRFQAWQQRELGGGIVINPHIAVFPLVARVIDNYLTGLGPNQRGMFIFDENKDVLADIEKAIQALRLMEGTLRLSNIIEKGFFIDSRKSLLLQLCDMCAFAVRRKEEEKAGITLSPLNATWTNLADRLIHRGSESFPDVIQWLAEQNKKGRPGT